MSNDEEYTTRQMKIKQKNIDKMQEVKKLSGRQLQWIVNYALEYTFEHDWEHLVD